MIKALYTLLLMAHMNAREVLQLWSIVFMQSTGTAAPELQAIFGDHITVAFKNPPNLSKLLVHAKD
jgi:hypothetical protein